MDFWLAVMFEDTEQLLDIARAAESLGFAGVAVADHIAVPERFASVHPSGENPFDHRTNFPDPLTSIAAMAAVTTRLRFMPYVYILPMREPFSVAKQAGTVAAMSSYRLALGVGAGWLTEEIALLGYDAARRGARLDEMIEVIRGVWSADTFEFHGRFFDFGPVGMHPRPTQRIPIWIGGKSDAALRRAARNDGWLGMNYDIDEIDVLLAKLRDERNRHLDTVGGGDTHAGFETLVIANALPTNALYDSLTAQGVTSTVCTGWNLGDPQHAPLAAKLDSMAEFSAAFISGR